jgi:hypothetical protein
MARLAHEDLGSQQGASKRPASDDSSIDGCHQFVTRASNDNRNDVLRDHRAVADGRAAIGVLGGMMSKNPPPRVWPE